MSRTLVLGSHRRVRAAAPAVTPDWEIVRNFNAGTDGAALTAVGGGLADAGTQGTFTTEQVYEGALAGKFSILDGQTGFGNWGGIIGFTSSVGKGDDLWLQHYIYIPASFVIDTVNGGGGDVNGSLKYIRLAQSTNGSPVGAGYLDLQMRDDAFTDSDFRILKEGQLPSAFWEYFGADGTLTRDVWHRHTMHVHFDDVLAASGGTSRIRFWQDGDLLLDTDTIATLNAATHTCYGLFLFTYFNARSTQDQHLYVDDIRIAKNGTPSWATGLEGV